MREATPGGGPALPPFDAEQMFDASSAYGRLRAGVKPEAKMNGFFHYLGVQQAARRAEARPLAFAARTRGAEAATLVVSSSAPGEPLSADVWLELVPFGGRGRLLLSFRLREGVGPAACRALLLTRGVLSRLCGPEAAAEPAAALGRLLSGGGADALEVARVLASVPEMDGEVDEGGFCKFAPFDLPEQAGHVEELPPGTLVAVVVRRP